MENAKLLSTIESDERMKNVFLEILRKSFRENIFNCWKEVQNLATNLGNMTQEKVVEKMWLVYSDYFAPDAPKEILLPPSEKSKWTNILEGSSTDFAKVFSDLRAKIEANRNPHPFFLVIFLITIICEN